MEERTALNLDEKIQKLINNYTELKNKYANLVLSNAELEKELDELRNYKTINGTKLMELETSSHKQSEEIEFLRDENKSLRIQVDNYDNKMKEASTKIDSIFDQLKDI
jgi:chromosome segregation ATPase